MKKIFEKCSFVIFHFLKLHSILYRDEWLILKNLTEEPSENYWTSTINTNNYHLKIITPIIKFKRIRTHLSLSAPWTYGVEGIMFSESVFKKSRLFFGEPEFLPSHEPILFFFFSFMITSSWRTTASSSPLCIALVISANADCLRVPFPSSIYRQVQWILKWWNGAARGW